MDSGQWRMDKNRGVQDSRFRCELSAFEKPPVLTCGPLQGRPPSRPGLGPVGHHTGRNPNGSEGVV